jgi:Plasmid encoded RepA protein
MTVMNPRHQLEFVGLEQALLAAEAEGATPSERRKLRDRLEVAHQLLIDLPTPDDIAFLHSGLCQTYLPHSRPKENHSVWRRESGRFTLIVTPGVLDERPREQLQRRVIPHEANDLYVGVPFGPKARLILIYLQSEGRRSRTVSMGSSMSAWIRSLGLAVTGGPRGSINAVKEQALRIARCGFTLQWEERDAEGNTTVAVRDQKIVDGLTLWNSASDPAQWSGTVELTQQFYEHLREHSVPLDRRAIAHLSDNSLGLDLYTLFAYRLPRLKAELHLRWTQLQDQLGAAEKGANALARRIREALPDVMAGYPDAKVEVTRYGLLLRPSPPAVPRTMVNGAKLTALG